MSVSIVMAIAAAFWAMGIGNSFTKFEEVEFTSAYTDTTRYYNGTLLQPDGNYFNGTAIPVYIVLKNSGTATATIDNILLNSKPYDTGYMNVTQINMVNTTLAVGQKLNPAGVITLPTNTGDWTSGSRVLIEIHTAAGRSYSYTVVLP